MRSENRIGAGFYWPVILALILFATGVVQCQSPTALHLTQHKDSIEQQEEIRLMFITVTGKKDDTVLFYRTGKQLVEVSFLFYDAKTIFKTGDAKPPYNYTGCFAALICLKHAYIYWLQRQPCDESGNSFYFKDS